MEQLASPESLKQYDRDEEATSTPTSRLTLAEISKAARAAIRAGEDKVGLAVTLYESVRSPFPCVFCHRDEQRGGKGHELGCSRVDGSLQVDRHIRRLDNDLLKYEDSLVIGLRAGTLPSHDAPSAAEKEAPGATTSLGAIALGEREAFAPAVPAVVEEEEEEGGEEEVEEEAEEDGKDDAAAAKKKGKEKRKEGSHGKERERKRKRAEERARKKASVEGEKKGDAGVLKETQGEGAGISSDLGMPSEFRWFA